MSQSNKKQQTTGFTLIELMLAMTFISVLLLVIAMTTLQISNIYTKGLTFRSVNQAGRTLSDSLRRDIAASTPFDIYKKGSTTVPSSCQSSPHYVRQCAGGGEYGGRLCLGDISYVWNYGKFIDKASASDTGVNYYANPASPSLPDRSTIIRLVRVIDSGGQLCMNPSMRIKKADATELLSGKDSLDLALHNFSITSSAASTDKASEQQMYAISFTIGTNEQEALTTNNTQCVPPHSTETGHSADWNYCAVNVFDIVVRASNKS